MQTTIHRTNNNLIHRHHSRHLQTQRARNHQPTSRSIARSQKRQRPIQMDMRPVYLPQLAQVVQMRAVSPTTQPFRRLVNPLIPSQLAIQPQSEHNPRTRLGQMVLPHMYLPELAEGLQVRHV